MFKKYLILIVSLVLATALLLPACAEEAPAPAPTPAPTPTPTPKPAEPITLKLAYTMPKGVSIAAGMEYFAEEVTKGTKGVVTIETYPMSALGPPPASLDIVLEGVTDIGFVPTTLLRVRFPLTNVVGLPGIGVPDTLEARAEAVKTFGRLVDKYPALAKEYEGFKLLWRFNSASQIILTKDKLVRLPEDVVGMKLGGSGMRVEIAEALGAVPVTTPPPASYEKLQTGVTEGQFLTWNMVSDYNIWEVIHYAIEVDCGGGEYAITMNLDSWNKMSPDVQNLMMGLTDEGMTVGHEDEIRLCKFARERTIEDGDTVTTPTPADKEKWNQAFEAVWDKWITDMNAEGLTDAEALFNEWRSASQKAWGD